MVMKDRKIIIEAG